MFATDFLMFLGLKCNPLASQLVFFVPFNEFYLADSGMVFSLVVVGGHAIKRSERKYKNIVSNFGNFHYFCEA